MIEEMEDAPGFAVLWAGQLGASVRSLERLRGGINNRVFRCGDGRQFWVIKGYAPTQPGQRDRMQAEVDFLRFAAQAAPGFTPELLQIDPERRCVVLEHLEGMPFPEGVSPSEAAVGEAVEFFRQLNAEPWLARESIKLNAAEGFLSLREHLGNVRQRLEGMGCAHLDQKFRPQAKTLLHRINIKLAHTEERTTCLIDQGIVADAIALGDRCVSPSDFGFHNAVLTPQGPVFLDFEFSGWDDPCKTSIDFNLQPRVPICHESTYLLSILPEDRRLHAEKRCQFLEPILRLKWITIILSILTPSRLDAILLATPTLDPQKLICNRIVSAQVAMNDFLNFSAKVKNF